ncbi:MAG TPA: asparagine synthase-related protein [Symbiobacteriaceae bacterium]
MSGIAGIWGRADQEGVKQMLEAQMHRGPHGRGLWTSPGGRCALGHDRLAIDRDEEQPVGTEDGTLWAVLDGELYNRETLRRRLEGRCRFRTGTDAELILHLFAQEGPDCLRHLDGVFALAIWKEGDGLYLARDPLGVKPLYFGLDDQGHLCFASEIKALTDRVQEIRTLSPGSCRLPDGTVITFYTLPEPRAEVTDPEQAVRAVEQTLRQAVRKRLAAGGTVGVLLSGGLDSSLIAAMVRQEVSGELHSFAVGLADSPDLRSARRVAEFLGTVHHERVLTPQEITAALPRVIRLLESCDPALVRGSIANFFVAEEASRYVEAVLSGEGADELFAGYHYLAEWADQPHALSRELREITAALHHTSLQRCDRMAQAHGLTIRIPFLDLEVVDLAFRIDPALKWQGGEGKRILRRVAASYLPLEIAQRNKEKFAIGTGVAQVLERYAASSAPGSWDGHPEEQLYWSIFRKWYGRQDILAQMGRSRSLNPTQRWVASI